ncbi:MAG: hypothetical protein HZA01_09790 [Nitrospinae bacterium]|nr:hypothetical protein [Nitrospinota bacterium]
MSLEGKEQKLERLRPYFMALAFTIGLGSFIYLAFGILYGFVNIWFPGEVAEICGYEFNDTDYTGYIHVVIGFFSLGLSLIGVWGIRDLVVERKTAKAGIAVLAMLAYSCGVAMMPTSEYALLVIVGLVLLVTNFFSGFILAYIITEFVSEGAGA